ncbi:Flp family type IVb pilin, partial [Vibrio vulnificus]|uniref:Flp family type IVb pilin n=1 Tax=Vibrio vulnificus TaxID=672 RepID=UPI001F5C88DE
MSIYILFQKGVMMLKQFINDESGATAIEYGILAAGLAAGGIVFFCFSGGVFFGCQREIFVVVKKLFTAGGEKRKGENLVLAPLVCVLPGGGVRGGV